VDITKFLPVMDLSSRKTLLNVGFDQDPLADVRNLSLLMSLSLLTCSLKKIGLTEAYQNEETTQAAFRCLLALPLLPVTDIDPAFQDVKALVHDDTSSETVLLELCRYVERQ